ncbi:hypothetical protein GLP30_16990 [Photobacterium phosphoreum]|uniref:Uncharacterized protein n=1 Tax=Photobacterium phosphoreum TaxID=659 RepID=A0AAW4ZSV9_PHOPO|nr:hypothetical protein [Photobacterium phosphoreum]MCD9492649.1 hypothetical protein [Photobacterium phosphoreum]MCF2191786.1 hypothetical protein [Photobacterium phosphoreum]MCF2303480.1 hypothetical protein [Photobacterium phosphoreum]
MSNLLGIDIDDVDDDDVNAGMVSASELQKIKDHVVRQNDLRVAVKSASKPQDLKDIKDKFTDFTDAEIFEVIADVAPRASVYVANRLSLESYIKLLLLLDSDSTIRTILEAVIDKEYAKK